MGASRYSAVALVLVLAACGQGTKSQSPTPSAPPPFAPSVEPVTSANTTALQAAFEAAFGAPSPDTLNVSGAQGGASTNRRLRFTPAALIDLSPDLVALISNGEGSFTSYDCAACDGQVSVDYLKRTLSGGFTKLGHWDLQAGGVSFGLTAPWTLRNDIDAAPVMLFAADEAAQGCAATRVSLVELTPTGAMNDGEVILNSGRQAVDGVASPGDYQFSGRLTPLVRGQSFAIDYSGTAAFRIVFTKGVDGKFASPDGGPQSKPPSC